ncbi:M20 aminoacylase family protein [Sulfurirhabdus autotrophica]|uniref:Hippurate hydrolase n=1 Tax=Sulfurirhabdus autotrophica TaxID=1706046 RepID=A0A4R3Y9G0_9PROT|nr:M20 aminoacylase family protein [Sulfurirhabdus autotrophica]TCV89005.1 hippurate hydrolase [Sulfurirhabdus autotrophica]
MSVITLIKENHERLVALRRDIHAHPELAFKENRTSDLVAKVLEAAGIEVHRGWAETGVVGALRAGTSERAIGLRADMDALPIQEQNIFSHRSTLDGKMHACGHDGHTAMLLGAAEYLAATRHFNGTVYFVFQPAEEGGGGARVMIEQGLFEKFPMQAVFGMHNWPGVPAGQFAIMPGPMMASTDQFDITVRGHGAHAAMPHQGADPVVAASALVQALQTITSRKLDPLDAAVLSVTRFHAGEAYNVIPERAVIGGTVRAFRQEVQEKIESTMEHICNGIAAGFGVQATLDYRRGYPATINSVDESTVCRKVASELVGKDNVCTDLHPSMGAEDFAFMLQAKPGCYVWLGNGLGEGGCMLHNPLYDFNDDILQIGASYWARLAEHWLSVT